VLLQIDYFTFEKEHKFVVFAPSGHSAAIIAVPEVKKPSRTQLVLFQIDIFIFEKEY
jgi:hypothetical protein